MPPIVSESPERDSALQAHGTSGNSKSAFLAIVLNCAFPGLGLAYLRRWGWAVANFAVVQSIVLAIALWNEPKLMEHIHWVIFALVVGSGSVARSLYKSDSIPEGRDRSVPRNG